jgi:hypothetical protein
LPIYQQLEAVYTERDRPFASSSLNVSIHVLAINGYTYLATRIALFRPGNKAAAHNRGPARKMQCRRGRAALFDVLDTTDEHGRNNWRRFWESQLNFALKGDSRASRLIAEFALGAPKQFFEVAASEPPPMINDQMSLAEMMRCYQQTLQHDEYGEPDDDAIH